MFLSTGCPGRYPLSLPVPFARHCQHQVAWYDTIPLLSYFLLRGQCRVCNARISIRYPWLNWFSAAGCGNGVGYRNFHRGTLHPAYLGFLILAPVVIPISMIDLQYQKIPNEITIPC